MPAGLALLYVKSPAAVKDKSLVFYVKHSMLDLCVVLTLCEGGGQPLMLLFK